jgi:hypothetical protein
MFPDDSIIALLAAARNRKFVAPFRPIQVHRRRVFVRPDRANPAPCAKLSCLGAWRSLVARTVRVGEVPGSNPGAPIAQYADPLKIAERCT